MEDNKLSKEYRKTNNRHLSRAKQFYEDYIALGNLREVGKKHDITKSEVSRLFKRWHQKGFLKYSIKEMRIENIRNQLLKDYNNLINKLRRHPTTSEMLRDEEWKNIYHSKIGDVSLRDTPFLPKHISLGIFYWEGYNLNSDVSPSDTSPNLRPQI